ncbi:MAG: DNA methyltransferase [Candidatus Hatepunaea meridiana]|nr:DNA methyltransferase [Candidatus Hatepunaea meridiana]
MPSNQLYFGDNLNVLRKFIPDESVDLIYLDPPFNSERAYNVIFKDEYGRQPSSQIEAFEDTWTWNPLTEQIFDEIMRAERAPYQLKQMMTAFRDFMKNNNLMAYLTMMAIRLIELHRVLKETGSLYLHCDSKASHYLKILLDNIFGVQNYRNEINWQRTLGHHLSTKSFDNMTDTIFFYSKGEKYTFNSQYTQLNEAEMNKKFPYIEKETGKRFTHEKLEQTSNAYSKGEIRLIDGRKVTTNLGWRWSQETFDKRLAENPHLIYWTKEGKPRYKRYADEYEGRKAGSLWNDIPAISSAASERLGYPTQKPIALLERIIGTSSNEGDTVLDPFCGCGTTIVAAEKLERKWVGIDITYYAIGLIKKRIKDQFPDCVYEETGIPRSREDAVNLFHISPFQFEAWAVYAVNGHPFRSKGGGDTGIDGYMYFTDYEGAHHKIIIEVKGGKYQPKDIRALKQVMDREKAPLGLLITLEPPTKGVISETAAMGRWKLPCGKADYQVLQILTIQDYFDGKLPHLPDTKGTLKEARRLIRNNERHPKLPGFDKDDG